MKKILYTAALFAATAVQAAPISITSGYGSTDIFTALGRSNFPVVSNYTHGLAPGSTADDLIGETLNFNDAGEGFFSDLDPLLSSTEMANYGNDWRIDFKFELSGTATFQDGILPAGFCPPGPAGACADGTLGPSGPGAVFNNFDGINPIFTFGLFELFYYDIHTDTSVKVLELTLTGFEAAPLSPNVVLHSEVNYGWYGGGNALVDNFFIDAGTGKSFYELSQLAPPPKISFRTDFNIDPAFIPQCGDVDCTFLTRSTDVNITGVFDVPEPASLAVLGLGLLGIGFNARRRKAAEKS